MTHAFVTIAIPFDRALADAVNVTLDALGNPPPDPVRNDLYDEDRPEFAPFIHFMSITVVPADADDPADRCHLVIELSADGTPREATLQLVERFGQRLIGVLQAAGIATTPFDLVALLQKHSIRTGAGLLDTPGLDFTGTPGMTVARIRAERKLAQRIRAMFDGDRYAGTALEVLQRVRQEIGADAELKQLLTAEPTELLRPSPVPVSLFGVVMIGLRGIIAFAWPYGLVVSLLVLLATCAAWEHAGTAVGLLVLIVGAMVGGIGLLVLLLAAWMWLDRLERSDPAEDLQPDPQRLAEARKRENRVLMNHLAGVSIMKPGRFRRLTLRVAFWVIGAMAGRAYRPGYLGSIGTIHFARWVLLPGSDKLLFFSNYGGSWESYLEDFITKAHAGLTGVWSNSLNFPRTRNLFQLGATDGDRFKRWARLQQWPTRFWYSAYPRLTTERIRTNAAIRHGLASAITEDEAQAWLTTLGSRLRPQALIETDEVQTILFGALKRHPEATALMLRLPDDPAGARGWLDLMREKVTFGDQALGTAVHQLSLSATGLQRLGLGKDAIDRFPLAFVQGMANIDRANTLGDTGRDAPHHWMWGHAEKPVDVALVIYGVDAGELDQAVTAALADAASFGVSEVHRIDLHLSFNAASGFAQEPFGFSDGVSQPILRGTKRWMKQADSIHTVEPGEFILGYPDNRGYLPATPSLPKSADPANLLTAVAPLHSDGPYPDYDLVDPDAERDLGRNGTFVVMRQLDQDTKAFHDYVDRMADEQQHHPGMPQGYGQAERVAWIEAKMVGRWRDGSSLVRFPYRPGSGWKGQTKVEPDNSFLLGAEDPIGDRCPFGAHIRRANPRDTTEPGSQELLQIVNRHRILRFGRSYQAAGSGDPAATTPGLLFMCASADIERQFEFVQQTWVMAPQFGALDNEVDPLFSRGGTHGRLTIPTPAGPIQLRDVPRTIRVRGGAYFFLPGRRTLRYLAALGPAAAVRSPERAAPLAAD